MLNIYRDGVRLTVTAGAFKQIFSPLGFMVENAQNDVGTSGEVIRHLEDETHENAENRTENSAPPGLPGDSAGGNLTENGASAPETVGEDSEVGEDLSDPDEVEKPLSEMSFSELLEYADSIGVDTEGAKSKAELRKLIKESK